MHVVEAVVYFYIFAVKSCKEAPAQHKSPEQRVGRQFEMGMLVVSGVSRIDGTKTGRHRAGCAPCSLKRLL